jgi:predicted Zn-ribbon and HTH transcriptional regulator
MIKNRRSSLSKVMALSHVIASSIEEPRTSEASSAETEKVMTGMIQKESEMFETDVEVATAKFGQDTTMIIKNMRNKHQGIAFRAAKVFLPSRCMRSFDND